MSEKIETREGTLTLAMRRLKKFWRDRRLTFILRVMLGILFILSAASKLPHQVEFIKVVTGYHLLPESVAHLYGSILPWLELAVGCLLIIGLFSRYAAGAIILMVISFIVANGTHVYSLEDCGCFEGLFPTKTSDALIIDIVIFIIAILILLNKDTFLSLGSLLRRKIRGIWQ